MATPSGSATGSRRPWPRPSRSSRSPRRREIATWRSSLGARAALAYSDARDHERALELVEDALELDPEDPTLSGTLSWILVRTGRYEPALAASVDALQRDPKLSWVIANGALALLALGRPDEALAEYARAVAARAEGDDFDDDVEALTEFIRERPDVRGGDEALRLLQESASTV